MIEKEVIVTHPVGLYARPATAFIKRAEKYIGSIWVQKEEMRVNAKSLLGVLSLGVFNGTTVKLIADGVDEADAISDLAAYIEEGCVG